MACDPYLFTAHLTNLGSLKSKLLRTHLSAPKLNRLSICSFVLIFPPTLKGAKQNPEISETNLLKFENPILCHLSSLLESRLSVLPMLSKIISSTPQSESSLTVGIGHLLPDEIQIIDFLQGGHF